MMRQRGTGSIYRQKGSSNYWVKYSHNGKPVYESTRTSDFRKAKAFLRTRLLEIEKGTFSDPKLERITVSELADDFLREYRVNRRKSLEDAVTRWQLHIKPFFGHLHARQVGTDLISRYVDNRQSEGAANGTINRELAALRRMFRLAAMSSPPKVVRVPQFPHLREANARTGFVDDAQYKRLANECAAEGSWLRAMFEVAYTYGWRHGELLRMKVKQVDLLGGTIRLEPNTTKNDDGREVEITPIIRVLLPALIIGKSADDLLFTREANVAVRDFRVGWWNACVRAGLGKYLCRRCGHELSIATECQRCGMKGRSADVARYVGLIFHDLRRTAARNLRRAGVAEGVIMRIGGWRTRSVFERYAIVSKTDISEAIQKLQCSRQAEPPKYEERHPSTETHQ